MIINNMRLRNFLSYGNYWSEINFNRGGLYLIVGNNETSGGSNGSGKSAIIDALAWALFGKTVRDIHLDNVTNYHVGVNTQVELEFTQGKDTYKITRYRKHRKFGNSVFLEKNGVDITTDHTRNTQKQINKIIHVDWLGFVNSIVFSSDNIVNFVGLNNDKKKRLLENLLDLDLFSEYLRETKDRTRNLKDDVDKIERELGNKRALLEEETNTRNTHKRKSKKFEEDRENRLSNCRSLIEEYSEVDPDPLIEKYKEIEEINRKQLELQVVIRELTAKESNKLTQSKEWETLFKAKKQEILKIRKKIEDITKLGNICHECESEITEGHKGKQIKKREDDIDDIKEEMKEFGENIISIEQELNTIKQNLKEVKQEDRKLQQRAIQLTPEFTLEELTTIKDKIDQQKELQKTIEEEKNPYVEIVDYTETKIKKFSKEIEKLKFELEELKNEQPYYKFWESAFDKDGLKVYILESIIPILNDRINFYLAQLFSGESFKLVFDKHLNETLIRDGIGGLNYSQNSQGERARVDFAISLAIFDVMQLQRGIVSNVLFFDEALDSGMDTIGVNKAFNILKNMNTETIFVISHRETMADNFDAIIQVVKDGNQSRITYR